MSALVPCMIGVMEARNAALTGQNYETPINEMMLALRIAERRAKLFGIDMPTDVPKGLGNKPDPLAFLAAINIATMDTGELERLKDILKNQHRDLQIRIRRDYTTTYLKDVVKED